MNLESLSSGIEKLINLESLNIISHNETLNLKNLPMEGIGKLNNLKTLEIDIRQLQEL